jgi:hypothetical protein
MLEQESGDESHTDAINSMIYADDALELIHEKVGVAIANIELEVLVVPFSIRAGQISSM